MTEKEDHWEARNQGYDAGHIAGYELAETRPELRAVRELLPAYKRAVEDLEDLLRLYDAQGKESEFTEALKVGMHPLTQMNDALRKLV